MSRRLTLTSPPRQSAEAFLVRVAELLHAYGTPAPRVERRLTHLAERLGEQVHVFSTPTAVELAFEGADGPSVYLRRIHTSEVDLGKLVEFDELLDDVASGRCSMAGAHRRLDALADAPRRYGPWVSSAGWAGASAAAAVLFGGGPPEVVVSAVMGFALAGLAHLWTHNTEGSGLFELVAAVLAGFGSVALASVLGPMSDRVLVLASLIVLFPGLSLTVAMIELATRHLASGTARLGGAFTSLLLLAFGVALGRALAQTLFVVGPEPEPAVLPDWAILATLAGSPLALAVLFQARPREFGWIIVSATLGTLAGRLGVDAFGPQLGSLIGAILVGLLANLYTQLHDRPASVPLMPGLLVLVPGSLGYRSLDLFMSKEAIAGLSTAFDTSMVGIALVGGLLIANVIIPPRRAL